MSDTKQDPQQEPSAQDRFFKFFQQEIIGIQEQMERLSNTALVTGERRDATDYCLARITRLSSEVKDASSTLPAYDLRTYSEAIKALQDKLTEIQAAFAPKQRFTFKTRKNASAISLGDAAELAAQKRKAPLGHDSPGNTPTTGSSFATTPIHMLTPPNERDTSQPALPPPPPPTAADTHSMRTGSEPNPLDDPKILSGLVRSQTSTTIASRISSHIIVPLSAQRALSPCHLSKLKSCCVDLSVPTKESAPFASLTINDVQSSLLLCGSVSGPAHITGMQKSVLVVSCRQFRMHECENIDIYLYCTSRPIIEGCKGIRFAKMPSFILDLLHPSHQIQPSDNLWNQIDDFKWLKAEQSPNWSIMPEDQVIPQSTWQEILPGKPGWSVTEILNAVKID